MMRKASILLICVLVTSLFSAHRGSASSPSPVAPTPVATPAAIQESESAVPPSPSAMPPEVEQDRARQAMEAVLQKYLRYQGPRYQVAPIEVSVEGEWAYGVARWQSEARTLSGPIHILARRMPNGVWQALMPSGEGLYRQWIDAIPTSLVPAGKKDQLRAQAAEADALWKTQAVLAVPQAGTATLPGGEGPVELVEPTYSEGQSITTPTLAVSLYEIRRVFQEALDAYMRSASSGKVFKLAQIRHDGLWAYAVAQEVNSEGYDVPYQSFVILGYYSADRGWDVLLPTIHTPKRYNALLNSFPSQLLSESDKAYLRQPEPHTWSLTNFNGHRLPWPAGQTGFVTKKGGSGHENQVDFDILGGNASGDVFASKPGTVVFVKESSNDGCCSLSCWQKANMVVVKHSDSEYSWYVHLAYNSVPVSVGDQIGFGTKVGVEGNTGYSCGVHLHYMASTGHTSWTNPADPNQAPWGTGITAVDFAETSWAGLTVGQGYTSQNRATCDATSLPSGYTKCADEGGRCNFSGTQQVYYGANSCYKVRSFTNGVDCNNSNFGDPVFGVQKACYVPSSTSTCNPNADQVALYANTGWGGNCVTLGVGQYPNPGHLGSVGNDNAESIRVGGNVRAILYEHDNYQGRSEAFTGDDSNLGDNHIGANSVSSVKVEWRAQSCNPSADQVALYANTGWGGSCVVLGIGEYPNPGHFASLGNDNAESIRVGSNVQAILYEHDNYQGRAETFTSDDSNLGDNYIGANSVSSVKVQPRAQPPSPPQLQAPANGSVFNEGQAINLAWSSTGNEYYGEVWGGPGGTLTFGWQSATNRNIGAQWAGYTYSWRVKARNGAGESGWSSTWTFTVRPAAPSNLSAETASCTQVNLYWMDNSGNEEGYKIYRNGAYVAQVGMNATSYQDTGLSGNTSYTYQVRAFRGGIESEASNTVNITTPSCAPVLPDLRPYAPLGYPYPVVPSSVQGTYEVNTLIAGEGTYFDWHFINSGNGVAAGAFHVELWLDGTRLVRYPYSYFNPGGIGGFDDWLEGVATPGWHRVRLIVDPDNAIAESDETNNIWERDFYWVLRAPYVDDTGGNSRSWWTMTGLWHLVEFPTYRAYWYGQDSTGNYNTGAANSGDLTSPPIYIPTTGFYLHFWYSYETETRGTDWDQRWIQISADGGPFEDVLQMYGDPMRLWLHGPVIDLSAYAGRTIQVRFYFDTVDGTHNNFEGWYVNSFGVSTQVPGCLDSREPNNNPSQAKSIGYGQAIDAVICPAGDDDLYTFTGSAGDKVVIDIDASVNGSRLDPYVLLLNSNGVSVLAENDDEIPGYVTDSRLGYQLPHDGTYYIKIRASNHLSAGAPDQFYRVRLIKDNSPPSYAAITTPKDNAWLHPTRQIINAAAIDNQSGIHRVEFFWHDADWQNSQWIWLGADYDGRDGWSWAFNTKDLPAQRGAALHIWAFDWAGNWAGATVWNLGVARTYLPTMRR